MEKIQRFAKNLLAKYGFELRRTRLPTLRFSEALADWNDPAKGRSPTRINIFDQDCRIQGEFLRSCQLDTIQLWSFEDAQSEITVPQPEDENGLMWLSVSTEQIPLAKFFARAPWTGRTDVLFVRSTLEEMSSGRCDLTEIISTASKQGLKLTDISTLIEPVATNVTCSRVILILTRPGALPDLKSNIAYACSRVAEAHAFLPGTIVRNDSFRPLCGRGSYGYLAGIFNPGAIHFQNRILILARAERSTWPAQEKDQIEHFTSCTPLLIELGPDHKILHQQALKIETSFELTSIRLEDFRLFIHDGHCYCSHSVITLPEDAAPQNVPVVLHQQFSRVGISELDPATATLRFLGFPKPDFPIGRLEKNWAMIGGAREVRFIYSMSPYRVLQSKGWPDLDFKTHIEQKIDFPFLTDKASVRNSISPVDYDDKHVLHIVHRIFPSKQYVYWALLIDKQTLLPSFISDRPLVRAGTSLSASIIYLCSAVVDAENILLFCGVNDIGMGMWRIKRSTLDRTWCALLSK